MQALRDEIDLRDQTREVENTRPSDSSEQAKVTPDGQRPSMTAELLSRKQEGITTDIRSALEDIRMLDHPDDYQQEIRLLQAVEKVMEDAARILARPDTGPDAIAAETEAIELLYQARRNNPGSGSGGGSGGAPGGGRWQRRWRSASRCSGRTRAGQRDAFGPLHTRGQSGHRSHRERSP